MLLFIGKKQLMFLCIINSQYKKVQNKYKNVFFLFWLFYRYNISNNYPMELLRI